MELSQRIQQYKQIEEMRQRPLIVYVTSTRQNVSAMMAGDAVREFIDQIDAIPQDQKSVDVLLHSSGGDALTAWKLMSILRERFNHVAILVPFMAFSAATIFSLGADEIVMHPHASLGPIDPQITITTPTGVKHFSYEDLGAFLRFLSEDAHVTEQVHFSTILDKLFSVVDPVSVGFSKRASELATDVGERLLQTHMTDSENKGQARIIAESLNKSFFAHGDAVSRSRARELRLKIASDNKALESLIWQAYLGIEEYLQLRIPFDYAQHYRAVVGAGSSAGIPNEAQFAYQNALVESFRTASEYRTEGVLHGVSDAMGNLQLNATIYQSSWRRVPTQNT